jgi:hypothetical protein
VTADYTVDASSDFVILCNATGKGTVTVTLPAVASSVGRMFSVKQINALTGSSDHCKVTPVATSATVVGTVTLDPPATGTNSVSVYTFVSDGNKWWIIGGGP